MRKKLIDLLYVGSIVDCKAATDQGWAVVHACKNPCHAEKCGQRPDPEGPNYLCLLEGTNLYLNMIDPPLPMFKRRMFEDFLHFARQQWEAGRPMLIHCNKGQSRAPTLALLFMAKVLGKLRNTSFDDAWLDFEVFSGEPYTPGEGLELWMRAHWGELDGGQPLPSMAGASEAAQGRGMQPAGMAQAPDAAMPADVDSNISIIRSIPLIHFSLFTRIEDKEHTWIKPEPNSLQFDIDEAYTWCMENNLPCRLIILKPRQVGCSTKCAHTCYHHIRRFKSDMVVIGDKAERTKKVFGIFNDISGHDGFAQRWDSEYHYDTLKGKFTYKDGSEGLVEHDTALDPKAGISGTRQIVWLTEAARYRKTNNLDKKVITAVLNSLANVPRSLGIAESTPEGASGWYYETFQGAVTLEDRKKGIVGNGWIKVFAPWFAFAEHCLKRTNANLSYFKDDLDARERRGILLYSWTAGQIAWRRMKIKKDCANDVRMFDQDFPEDPESCFLASGRPRFDMDKLTKFEARAKILHHTAEMGAVERSENGEVGFVPKTDGGAWLWMIERPKFGCRYLSFIDPCTGAQNEGSPFPDAHAAGVWRAGYMEENRWHKPRLVAAIDVPNGCRWEDSMISERLKDLADLYGGCMVVPETGNGLGVLYGLQQHKATVYERQKMDSMYPDGAGLRIAGWETTSDTRPIVVNALADAIAGETVEVEYLPAIHEWKTVVIKDRGKAEAKSGCHDDWAMGPAIGLQCLNYAKTLLPPQRFRTPSLDDEREMDRALS